MSTPDSFEATADALNRVTRARIARVGLQRDPQHAPGIEGVAEHQQLGLCVAAGALGRRREPGTADLRHGRDRVEPRRGAPRRPGGRRGPVVQVKESGRANYGLAAQVKDGERERTAGPLVRQGGLDVLGHRLVVSRDPGEVISFAGLCCRAHEGAHMAEVQGFQLDAAPLQGHGWGHVASLGPACRPGPLVFARKADTPG